MGAAREASFALGNRRCHSSPSSGVLFLEAASAFHKTGQKCLDLVPKRQRALENTGEKANHAACACKFYDESAIQTMLDERARHPAESH